MSTKIDSASTVETHHVQSTASISTSSIAPVSSPKVSKFGAKSGFVIPKNKLSGSLIPIFRGGKIDTTTTVKEESTKQVQRKTKWGVDLTQDAAVRKGRALAYQVRLEQITLQLKAEALEIGDDQLSQSPKQASDIDLSSDNADRKGSPEKLLATESLELERREIFGEILRLNPSYKAPADYKPLLKEAKVPIPNTLEYEIQQLSLIQLCSSIMYRLKHIWGTILLVYCWALKAIPKSDWKKKLEPSYEFMEPERKQERSVKSLRLT